MKRNKTMTNGGYSFVEMLIVLAILAVMSAMALLTWNTVNKARYQSAVSTFESELDTLRTQTMAQDKRGYLDDAGHFHEVSASTPDSSLKSDYYSYRGVSDPVFLMKQGTIKYSESGAGTDIDGTGVIVQYKKADGSVTSGYGTFQFVTSNGDTVANIHLVRVTGTHFATY